MYLLAKTVRIFNSVINVFKTYLLFLIVIQIFFLKIPFNKWGTSEIRGLRKFEEIQRVNARIIAATYRNA
jgi:hypothetical protein